jgi:hypothetical protein|tara:strand:+ start:334 stop:930 length:597 start_codon:yes stop_codon:yes gene_type:complete
MKIIERNIDELISAEYNPRQMTKKQHNSLTDSIKQFGLVDPILVNIHQDRKDIIIGGHQRVTVAKELGITTVPTVELELSADKERELNVRLNRNTGEWNWDGLANNFDVEELTEWGFNEKELLGEISKDLIEPEIEITPELFESHNYLILYFDNDFDWQSAVDSFDIKPMHASDSKDNYKRVGTGRVLNGTDVLKRLL